MDKDKLGLSKEEQFMVDTMSLFAKHNKELFSALVELLVEARHHRGGCHGFEKAITNAETLLTRITAEAKVESARVTELEKEMN